MNKAKLIGINHLALEVGDLEAALELYEQLFSFEYRESPKGGVDFDDPWGNHFQIIDYREIQFERTEGVKRKLGISGLEKIADRGLGGSS